MLQVRDLAGPCIDLGAELPDDFLNERGGAAPVRLSELNDQADVLQLKPNGLELLNRRKRMDGSCE